MESAEQPRTNVDIELPVFDKKKEWGGESTKKGGWTATIPVTETGSDSIESRILGTQYELCTRPNNH